MTKAQGCKYTLATMTLIIMFINSIMIYNNIFLLILLCTCFIDGGFGEADKSEIVFFLITEINCWVWFYRSSVLCYFGGLWTLIAMHYINVTVPAPPPLTPT